MDAARTRDGEEHARAVREVAVGGGGVTGGLFVVERDETDSERYSAVGEGGYGNSDDAEHVVDAEVGKGLGS